MITIQVETAFDNCDKCKFYRLETDEIYADGKTEMVIRKCRYKEICENAVTMYLADLCDKAMEKEIGGNK